MRSSGCHANVAKDAIRDLASEDVSHGRPGMPHEQRKNFAEQITHKLLPGDKNVSFSRNQSSCGVGIMTSQDPDPKRPEFKQFLGEACSKTPCHEVTLGHSQPKSYILTVHVGLETLWGELTCRMHHSRQGYISFTSHPKHHRSFCILEGVSSQRDNRNKMLAISCMEQS